MAKKFNVTGNCIPEKHYTVDITGKLSKICKMIENEEYFTINKARQFGKTTTLFALRNLLKDKYLSIRISFERIGDETFATEETFVQMFIRAVTLDMQLQKFNKKIINSWNNKKELVDSIELLSEHIAKFCSDSEKDIVLMIDEVDKSSNNSMFLNFLGMIREMYLLRSSGLKTFRSVILASVYDVKNLTLNNTQEKGRRYNSPWNIAVDFKINMSFNSKEIASMLKDYENDYHTKMNINKFSNLIYEYTSGYPILVSRMCKIIDEELCEEYGVEDKHLVWSKSGFLNAVKIITETHNLLFDDIDKKLLEHKELDELLKSILIKGRAYTYAIGNDVFQIGELFGILTKHNNKVIISNRIFEIYLYNKYISKNELENEISNYTFMEKNQFIHNGILDMELILKKFQEHFKSEYKNKDNKFLEDNGRFLFLTFIKPIINGVGNYYVESRTRNQRRTDVIIDYHSQQYIVELKIWHGEEYNKKDEKQTFEYLDYYNKDKGYMVSFNFNKNKKYTLKKLTLGMKTIVEVVV